MNAIVLSGGGSLGIAHIGVLHALESQIPFSHYYGVSAGAIIAAAHACGKTAPQISQIVHTAKLRQLLFDISKSNFGLMKGEKIMDFLETIFESKTFEDLKNNNKILQVFATDFTSGERVCLQKGSIAKAVRASISVPMLFEPYYYEGKWLVDGGLSGNLPLIDAIEHYTGERIIAVDVATNLKDVDFTRECFWEKPKSIRQMMERTVRILFKTQQYTIPQSSKISYIRPNLSAFTTLDIRQWKAIEKIGYESAIDFLKNQ